MEKYYVYVYLDPTKKGNFSYTSLSFLYEPFYIGKGSGNRWFHHLKKAKSSLKTRSHLINKIRKILSLNFEPIIEKISINLTELEAYEIEEKFISTIGRIKDGGSLVNFLAGGIDDNVTNFLQKRRENLLSINEKISIAKKGVSLTDSHKKSLKKPKTFPNNINPKKGKTDIEFFGEEKAISLKKNKSEKMKGHKPFNKGKKLSEMYSSEKEKEIREKLSISHIGKKPSIESNLKRSKKLSKKIIAENNPYDSLSIALVKIGISMHTLLRRLRSDKFPNYYYYEEV